MHVLFYNFNDADDGKVFLTNREFKEALIAWQKNTSYFCERLQSLCPPPPALKLTKRREGYLINPKSGGKDLLFIRSGEYIVEYYKGDGSCTRLQFENEEARDKFENSLVTEDEYYDNLKLIK